MSGMEVFVRQVRSRSSEHKKAMDLVSEAGLAGQMVSILRQEIDSLIRVFYLLTQNEERRDILISASVDGARWTHEGKRSKVRDSEMVDLAEGLIGWTRLVYDFGCAFIHLSNLHDYNDRDPLSSIAEIERKKIFHYCRQYHGGPAVGAENFENLLPYIPKILTKISDNLDYYLEKLEEGAVIPPHKI